MKRNHDIIELECDLEHETDGAYLVDYDGSDFWVPKSLCVYADGVLQIPEWLAIKKEMI